MITKRKILNSMMAAICVASICTTMMPLSISAESTEVDYDINGDGVVNVSDVAAISRYLAGNAYEPDYNKLDVNKSFTVDKLDEQCLLAQVMNKSYKSSYFSRKTHKYSTAQTTTTFIPNAEASLTTGREYMRYSYIQKKQLSNYKLTPSKTPLTSNSASGRAIIGTDDRYLSRGSENVGIVRLSTGGTGFIVGDHQIATAAHCVYGSNGWVTEMSMNTYNENGKISNNTLTAVEAHIPSDYTTKTSAKYDYALITVKEDLSDYVHFDLADTYNLKDTYYSNIPIYLTGCPQAITDSSENVNKDLYSGEGHIINKSLANNASLNNSNYIHYDIDTIGGQSGSPVYTVTMNVIDNKPTYSYTAIAIHHGGSTDAYNVGARVTKYVLQFYRNNPFLNY